jgi:uncharacterized RDD family membrane protein YckC
MTLLATPSLPRRFASLFYEALLLAAVLFLAGYLVVGLMPGQPSAIARLVHQIYLMLVAGIYFTWFWCHGGQTVAMKTWRIKVELAEGGRLGYGKAWLRYLLAVAGVLAFGIGLLWALVDRDRQFLHDRLAGTRLVVAA